MFILKNSLAGLNARFRQLKESPSSTRQKLRLNCMIYRKKINGASDRDT